MTAENFPARLVTAEIVPPLWMTAKKVSPLSMTSTISHTAFDVNQKLPTALIAINNNNSRNNGGNNDNGNCNGNNNCHNNDVSAINNSKFELGGVKV